MKTDMKYNWYKESYIGDYKNGGVRLHIRMTIPLYLEGKYNNFRRKYMDFRKRLGLKR